MIEKLSRPDAADLITAPGKTVDIAGLRAELATCRARLEEIAADYDDDKITRTQFLTQTDARRAKMARIEEQLAEATEVSPLTPLIGAADVAAAWDGLTLGAAARRAPGPGHHHRPARPGAGSGPMCGSGSPSAPPHSPP